MNESSVTNPGSKARKKLLLLWAVSASIVATYLLGWMVSQSREQVARPEAKPGEVAKSLPLSTPEPPSEPPSTELTTTLEPPLAPPLPEIYISELPTLSFLSGWGQSGVNKSVIGNLLTLGGKTYEHGLGTHANAEAIFPIPAEARRFVAVVGLDDEVGEDQWGRGSVCFEVYGDMNEMGEPPVLLGKSPVLSPKTARVWSFDLELTSHFERIELVVSDAGDGNECDHADWVNAGFLK